MDNTDQLNSVPGDDDNDLQITLVFSDGTDQTFTIIRDRDMRWRSGGGTQLESIEASWFYNPATIPADPEIEEVLGHE